MINTIKPGMPEITDHRTFRETITQLDGILTKGRRSATVGIALFLATTTVQLFLKRKLVVGHLEFVLIVDAFILLTLACSAYGLVQYSLLNDVRNRLLEQLEMSIKQRRRADKLYDLSILDPLTGLHNRRFGEERLKQEIDRAERSGDSLVILIFDLDHFKDVNDQFGHAAGDSALQEFSRRLRKAVRSCDVPVRIGGDEFLVILPDCARDKVNAILSRLATPELKIDSRKVPILYSVGRSQYQAADTTKTLLNRADKALYEEKRKRSGGSWSSAGESEWPGLTPGDPQAAFHNN